MFKIKTVSPMHKYGSYKIKFLFKVFSPFFVELWNDIHYYHVQSTFSHY